MTAVKSLYDEDFFAWSQQQAEALRSAAHGGSNYELDWENLAEEIEGLARSERRELASRLSLIIEHLAKLNHSSARYPRRRWRETIRRERVEVERLLEDNPSLRREVPVLISKETPRTVDRVVGDLVERGELSRSLRQSLKAKTYLDLFGYSEEQVLGDWFPSEPEQPKRGE
jgi:Domain of unknown function DUF29